MSHSSGNVSVDASGRWAAEIAGIGNAAIIRPYRRIGPVPRLESVDDIIGEAVSRVMANVMPAIRRQITSMAGGRFGRSVAVRGAAKPPRAVPRRGRRRGAEITKWVADKKARRVPTFVIELTGGLDTKKKIVAKYGENAIFEKGNPAPKPK
jgi:hypothetical protein